MHNESSDWRAADARADAPGADLDAQHPDATLIRILDTYPDVPVGSGAAFGLDDTDIARLELLKRRSDRLTALLAAEVPSERDVTSSAEAMRPEVLRAAARARLRARVVLATRAAAACALLIVALAAVPPARAWIVEHARAVAAALGLGRDAARATATGDDAVSGAATGSDVRISFAVRAPVLEIAAPPGTTVVLRRGDGLDAHAESSGVVGAAFVVVPDGLRIEGGFGVGGIYLITLPAHVEAVRMEHADGSVVQYAVPAAGRETRIQLTGS